ncbi:hypothetical protein [Fibrella forsythiae]|uniref:Uncharacterized protein n=1 Tax=Fibrella forsythiae TaxID=2817061 RepID=A0ABS3JM14_9BACT|nr:hypothetical protein [Fibrella forsythiae]MBO0951051.1 hypothetical protein [Fibrella forsythiae]
MENALAHQGVKPAVKTAFSGLFRVATPIKQERSTRAITRQLSSPRFGPLVTFAPEER